MNSLNKILKIGHGNIYNAMLSIFTTFVANRVERNIRMSQTIRWSLSRHTLNFVIFCR